MTLDRRASAFAAAIAIAVVAWDPRAPAADAKRALGLLVAVIALAVVVARPLALDPRRTPPRAALAFLAFVAWSGLTLAWGVPSGARDLGAWVAASGIALVASGMPEALARRLAERAAMIAGVAASAIAIAERLSGARGIFVHGGQGNANWLGLLLAVTLPLTPWIFTDPSRKTSARAAHFAVLAIQIAGLALSHSRVAWAATAIAAMFLAAPRARLAWASGKRVIIVVATAAVVAIAVVAARRPAPSIAVDPKPSAPSIAEGSDVPVAIAWTGRVWIWTSSLDAAAASLPFGAGLGGFGHAYLDAQGKRLAGLDPKVASRRFLNATTAHSDWIEVLVDAGPLGILLLAIAIAWTARDAMKSGWPRGASAIVALAVCAAGDSPLRQPGLVMLVGLVVAGNAGNLRFALAPRLVSTARIAVLVASALLLARATGGFLASRRLTAAKDASPPARRALLASAARLDPSSGEIALERGLFELESEDADAALPHLLRARALLANAGTDIAIGNAHVMLDRHDDAIAAYVSALARHPGSFRAHANITTPLVARARLDDADRHLAIATSLWPGHPRLGEMARRIKHARIDRDTGLPTDDVK